MVTVIVRLLESVGMRKTGLKTKPMNLDAVCAFVGEIALWVSPAK